MYNTEQKEGYIKSKIISDRTVLFLEQMFGWFEPYERQWGADLTTQPAEILQPVINELSGLRKKSSAQMYSMLREYANWSKQHGYIVNEGIYKIELDNKDKIKHQMVSSPSELYEIMKKRTVEFDNKQYVLGFDSPEKETVDVIYRTFLWLAFSGLKDVDAIEVLVSDVNLQTMHITYNGNIYPIYEEGSRDFEKACTLENFVYLHPHYTTFKSRASGCLLLRGIGSSHMELSTIRPIINKRLCVPDSKNKISYRRIWLSGLFYRTYLREAMGIPVNFLQVVADEMKDKQYSQSKTRTLNTIANRYSLELYEDYIEWKETFYSKTKT